MNEVGQEARFQWRLSHIGWQKRAFLSDPDTLEQKPEYGSGPVSVQKGNYGRGPVARTVFKKK